jgi:hypothetical protein
MSLQLKISAIEENKSFVVTDCTGKYSSSNQGGFGAPNIQTSDIETSILFITTPDKTEFQINVYPDFPNKDGIAYEILPYMLNMQEIESGEYNLKLVITGTDKKGVKFTKTAYHTQFMTKTVSCCIDKIISKNIGTTDKLKKQEMIELNDLLKSLEYSIDCGRMNRATKIVDLLKETCSCCDCKN